MTDKAISRSKYTTLNYSNNKTKNAAITSAYICQSSEFFH